MWGWENVKRRGAGQVSPEGREDGAECGWVGFTDRVKSRTTVQQCASPPLYFLLLSATEARRPSGSLLLAYRRRERAAGGAFTLVQNCPNTPHLQTKVLPGLNCGTRVGGRVGCTGHPGHSGHSEDIRGILVHVGGGGGSQRSPDTWSQKLREEFSCVRSEIGAIGDRGGRRGRSLRKVPI